MREQVYPQVMLWRVCLHMQPPTDTGYPSNTHVTAAMLIPIILLHSVVWLNSIAVPMCVHVH